MAELEASPLADLVVDVGLSVEQVQELLLTDPNDLPQYVWDEDGDAELCKWFNTSVQDYSFNILVRNVFR